MAPQLTAQEIRFEIKVSPQHMLRADREMLRRAVFNLVLNALDAMPQGGTLTIGSTATTDGLELHVADSGPGLPAEILPRVFEPFFTTKPSGTGLGLAIVSRVAEAHGGTVSAGNGPRGGAVFTLRFPIEVGGQRSEIGGQHPTSDFRPLTSGRKEAA